MRSLMLWQSALICIGGVRAYFCLIDCARLMNRYLKLMPVSPIYCPSVHLAMHYVHYVSRISYNYSEL